MRITSPNSIPKLQQAAMSSSIPEPSSLFHRPQVSGAHTQGDSSYLSLIRAHSSPPNPNIPLLLHLLSQMRLAVALHRRPPFPEYLFPPFFRAFAASRLPDLAVRLFHDLRPVFACPPTSKSLNSALAVLSDHRPGLAIAFYHDAVSRYSGVSPNALTFNLLIKAAVRCGEVDDGVALLREMGRCGLKADGYSYSTVIDGLCRGKRVDEAMGLLDEMQA